MEDVGIDDILLTDLGKLSMISEKQIGETFAQKLYRLGRFAIRVVGLVIGCLIFIHNKETLDSTEIGDCYASNTNFVPLRVSNENENHQVNVTIANLPFYDISSDNPILSDFSNVSENI